MKYLNVKKRAAKKGMIGARVLNSKQLRKITRL